MAGISPRAAAAVVLLLLAACASTDAPRPVRPEFDLHHPDALRRTLAIQDVAARGDRRWLPDLVELLDDDDATVRLQAGAALKELSGHDVGYQAYASRSERLGAMAAWRSWLGSTGATRGGP
jgi:HEAT repeat protein